MQSGVRHGSTVAGLPCMVMMCAPLRSTWRTFHLAADNPLCLPIAHHRITIKKAKQKLLKKSGKSNRSVRNTTAPSAHPCFRHHSCVCASRTYDEAASKGKQDERGSFLAETSSTNPQCPSLRALLPLRCRCRRAARGNYYY